MSWRYQPVYQEDMFGRTVTLCECYFDEHGKLEKWTEDGSIAPLGETPEELQKDLIRMLADSYKWEPVAFSSLIVGMTFTRTDTDVETTISALYAALGLKP